MEREGLGTSSAWTSVEQSLWAAYRAGEWVDLRTQAHLQDTTGSNLSGTGGALPGVEGDRRVRASVLIEMLRSIEEESLSRHPNGLRLAGVRLTGNFDLGGVALGQPLVFVDTHFDEPVVLRGVKTSSAITLHGCEVPWLDAAELHTDRSVVLYQCTIPGSVDFSGSQIGGDLTIERCSIGESPSWRIEEFASASKSTQLAPVPRRAAGGILLGSADVQGSIWLNGTTVVNSGGTTQSAVTAAGLRTQGDLLAEESFRATGRVYLLGARVAGSIVFSGAWLDGDGSDALLLEEAAASRLWLDLDRRSRGRIHLRDAVLGRVLVEPIDWPDGCLVDLAGVRFDRLDALTASWHIKDQIAWLDNSTSEYFPTAYEQLASARKREGHESDARLVYLHKERRRHRALPWTGRAWGAVQDGLVGYGYSPVRALTWLVVLMATGTLYFSRNQPDAISSSHPTWNALMYVADLMVPVANLGYQNAFDPVGSSRLVAVGLALTGWVLAAAVLAAVSRTVTRQ